MNDAKLLKKLVHIGASRLGMDRETRRILQRELTGHVSCADMTPAQLMTVIHALNRKGARLRVPGPRAADDRAPLIGKVRALLHAGNYPEEYAAGISKRMFGAQAPARLEWHNSKQLRALVAALMYDAKRKRKAGAA